MTIYLVSIATTSFATGIVTGLYLTRRNRLTLFVLLVLIAGTVSTVVGASIRVEIERTKARIETVRKLGEELRK